MHACFVNAMFGKRGADESFKATLGQHHWSLFKVRIKPQVAGGGGAGAYRAKIRVCHGIQNLCPDCLCLLISYHAPYLTLSRCFPIC